MMSYFCLVLSQPLLRVFIKGLKAWVQLFLQSDNLAYHT